jgi:hypothetical protein
LPRKGVRKWLIGFSREIARAAGRNQAGASAGIALNSDKEMFLLDAAPLADPPSYYVGHLAVTPPQAQMAN